jgi:hypothetical protein
VRGKHPRRLLRPLGGARRASLLEDTGHPWAGEPGAGQPADRPRRARDYARPNAAGGPERLARPTTEVRRAHRDGRPHLPYRQAGPHRSSTQWGEKALAGDLRRVFAIPSRASRTSGSGWTALRAGSLDPVAPQLRSPRRPKAKAAGHQPEALRHPNRQHPAPRGQQGPAGGIASGVPPRIGSPKSSMAAASDTGRPCTSASQTWIPVKKPSPSATARTLDTVWSPCRKHWTSASPSTTSTCARMPRIALVVAVSILHAAPPSDTPSPPAISGLAHPHPAQPAGCPDIAQFQKKILENQ